MTDQTNENVEIKTPADPAYTPPQLSLFLLTKPTAGDDAKVYPTDEGWVAEYPDGSVEVLIECKNLKTEFTKIGLDDDAKPVAGGQVAAQIESSTKVYQRGEVVASTVTWELLDSLDMAGLRKIGDVLGVKGTSKEQLAADIAEYVGLNKRTEENKES